MGRGAGHAELVEACRSVSGGNG